MLKKVLQGPASPFLQPRIADEKERRKGTTKEEKEEEEELKEGEKGSSELRSFCFRFL
jgi:hypothetical protein